MNWQSAGRAIWRYRWLAAALTAILVVATAVVVGSKTPVYKTEGKVRLVQKVGANDLPALETAAQNAASYSILIDGDRFAKLVIADVGDDLEGLTEAEVKGTLSGSPVPGTDILRIFAEGNDPERITTIARAAVPGLQQLALDQGGREVVEPVDTPYVPASPSSPRVRLAIAIALILGLVINGALMVLLDLLRDRYADADELQDGTGRPVLATVPRFSAASFVGRGADESGSGREAARPAEAPPRAPAASATSAVADPPPATEREPDPWAEVGEPWAEDEPVAPGAELAAAESVAAADRVADDEVDDDDVPGDAEGVGPRTRKGRS